MARDRRTATVLREGASMRSGVAALSAFFGNDPRTTRYGMADRQWGLAQLAACRAAAS